MASNKQEDLSIDANPLVLKYLADFLNFLQYTKQLTVNSRSAYQRDIKAFLGWLVIAGEDPLALDSRSINQYLYMRMAKGYKPSSNARLLASLKAFYKYLLMEKVVSLDPCFAITTPKILPSNETILTAEQVELLMLAPDVETAIGLRDKAMLEVLYSTGVSVSELISLKVAELNLQSSMLKVESSKGEQRIVYLTEQCCHWLGVYLTKNRGKQSIKDKYDWIFLSERCQKMTRQTFWYRIKAYVAKSELSDNISPQTLRRSFAVHILASGVEPSVAQQILGHKQQISTAKYKSS